MKKQDKEKIKQLLKCDYCDGIDVKCSLYEIGKCIKNE